MRLNLGFLKQMHFSIVTIIVNNEINITVMRAELIQEFQLLQNSRANKFRDELSEQIKSSVDLVTEKVHSSMAKRGNMLLLLEKKFDFSTIRKIKRKFIKF